MKKKGIIIGIIVAIVLVVAVVVFLFLSNKVGIQDNKSTSNKKVEKNITIEIIPKDLKKTNYTLTTKKTYLKDALKEVEGLEYACNEYNELYTVNGITYDVGRDGLFWEITINDEAIPTTFDKVKIKDGDNIVICFAGN